MRTAWRLYDPIELETYFLPVNPSEDAGSNSIMKNTGYESLAGSYQDSLGEDRIGSIVFYSNFELEKFSYNGKTYNEQDHLDIQSWMEKDYPIELTDDLGRSWLILTESFDISRLRGNVNKPFKHQYNWTGIILSEIEVL